MIGETKINLLDDQARSMLEEYIWSTIDDYSKQAKNIHPAYARLWDKIKDSIGNGKMIRPYLTLIAYGKTDDRILPVASAWELLHSAMLIHDDIIDEDDIRYGKPNINGQYKSLYKRQPNISKSKIKHYSYSMAILAGDLLLAEAVGQMGSIDFKSHIQSKVRGIYKDAVFRTIGGELMDVEASFCLDFEYDTLSIYEQKTAYYSFFGPLASGAICAGFGDEVIDVIAKFARVTGLAYQLQDDLLGLFASDGRTGKSTYSDLEECKQTYLMELHSGLATGSQLDRLSKLQSGDTDLDNMQRIKTDIHNTGAKSLVSQKVDEYFVQSIKYIDLLPNHMQKPLISLVESIQKRSLWVE